MNKDPIIQFNYKDHGEIYLKDLADEPALIECPNISNLIGDLKQSDTLSIGCGAGKELLTLKSLNAKSISAVEVSPFLIDKAKELCCWANILEGDVEAIPFPDNSFDFIYCGHVLHYLKDWSNALSEIKRVLKPSGDLLVTLHHPIDWGLAPTNDDSKLLGYKNDGSEQGNYLLTKELSANWYEGFEVVFYSRSIATTIREFITHGFTLRNIVEDGMTEDASIPLYFALSLRLAI